MTEKIAETTTMKPKAASCLSVQVCYYGKISKVQDFLHAKVI